MLRLTANYLAAAIFASTALTLTTGCGMEPAHDLTVADGTVAITGTAMGGQQPITGGHVYLKAVATSGYGALATDLITSGGTGVANDATGNYVTTGTNGSFALTGKYTCTAGQLVYIMITGGNPGLATGTNNAAITQLSTLGKCPTSGSFSATVPSLVVNELTTVATAYALAGYAVDSKHIASDSGVTGNNYGTIATTGIGNAIATAQNMVSIQSGNVLATTQAVSGYSSGLSANGTVPAARINALASLVAACVNSDGTGTACSQLFGYAPSATGSIPTNTADALINIAHSPSTNVAKLFNMIPTQAVFPSTLTTAPADWTLQIRYSVPQMMSRGRVAIDKSGNIWIANFGGTSIFVPNSSGGNSITELSPTGVVLSGASGFTGGGMNQPTAPFIDANGNVWVSNYASSVISELGSNGSPVTTTGHATTSNNYAYGVSVTHTGSTVWMSGDQVTNSYVSATFGGAVNTVSGTHGAAAVEDASSNMWSLSFDVSQLTSTSPAGVKTTTSNGLYYPTDLAQDASGNFWVVNSGSNALTEYSASTAMLSPSAGFTGGGLDSPWVMAIDGTGNVFAGNNHGNISEFNKAGSALTQATTTSGSNTTYGGFVTGSQYPLYGMAVDPSGNLWASGADGFIYQMVGAGSPVITPLTYNKAASRP